MTKQTHRHSKSSKSTSFMINKRGTPTPELRHLSNSLIFLPFLPSTRSLRFTHARTRPRAQALLTVSPSGLIYSTHIFLCSLLYVPSFLCLCLLEASRCPGLLVRGATGGYRRFGARALHFFCGSLGYRCAQGQICSDRPGLRRKREGDTIAHLENKTECLTLQKNMFFFFIRFFFYFRQIWPFFHSVNPPQKAHLRTINALRVMYSRNEAI